MHTLYTVYGSNLYSRLPLVRAQQLLHALDTEGTPLDVLFDRVPALDADARFLLTTVAERSESG